MQGDAGPSAEIITEIIDALANLKLKLKFILC